MDAAGNWLKPAQAQPGQAWAMCWRATRPAAGPWLLLLGGLLLLKELQLATNLSPQTSAIKPPQRCGLMAPSWRQRPSTMPWPAAKPIAAVAPVGRHRWP